MGKKYISFIFFCFVCCNVFATYEFDKSEYYVKQKATGAGDGSSWEDAMGANTFAIALSKLSTIKSGTTFHLAAGTYYPEYDPFSEKHLNYSENEKERYKAYYVQTPIKIIGGYSYNPKDGEKPNPMINETIITGEYADSKDTEFKETLYHLFCLDLEEKAQCCFSGLILKTTSDNRYETGGAFWFNSAEGTILKLDNCTTKDLSNVFPYASKDKDEVYLSNCLFDNSIQNFYLNASKAELNSCTFIERSSSITVNDLTVQNCTFCQISMTLYTYEKLRFHNNTVVRRGYNGNQDGANMRIEGEASIIGNIFDSQINFTLNGDNTTGVSKYNLYDKTMTNEDNPLYDSKTDYLASLNGVLDSELTYGKSYTPYFKLLRDRLPDSRIVHFPLSETSVKKDQRGVVRFDNTCMGSYEKRDTVMAERTETIQAGETFQGEIRDTVGLYYIPVKSPNAAGCDSITLHKLLVLPNDKDKRTTFYVKMDGTGDGSSWEKAMSPKNFAWRLCLSKRVDTFHVAAGTYYPPMMEEARCFERSLPVCIFGGYPENCMDMSQEPNPVLYKTIFSVDFNNDNIHDDNGISNIDEDGFTIFSYTAKRSGNCLFSGIVFDGGLCDRNCINAQCQIYDDQGFCEFTFEQCEFRRAKCRSINCNVYSESVAASDVLNINNCYFNRVGEYYYHYPVQSDFYNVNYNACTFDCLSSIDIYSSNQTVSYYNCTLYNCANIMLGSNTFSNLNLINNTIYSSTELNQNNKITIGAPEYIFMTGNIIYAILNENSEITGIHSNYNVYYKKPNINQIKSENDIVVEDCSFLDNKLSKVDNVITPVLVMTSDTLPDGTSLRFPLSETNITDDQRKWNRYRMTSVGSYEAECQKDSSYLTVTDTIYVGDVYMGQTFVKEGLNYGIDTLHNAMGCDSLIFHPVFVLPERNIPTAFTPFDSNNKNDVFMQGHEIYIYDIYGTLICHSENGWNGMIKEEKANAGIYVYAVKMVSGEIKRGTIELLIQQ